MNKALTSSRKAFTATVVAATISWSIGLSALVAPIAAKAAVSGGTLVKASLPAVYYIGSDMKRYVFPNEKTFKTWYADFSSVMTITDAELASIPLAGGGNGNVTYKPGTRMVKITTDPKVYVVDAGGVLRPIASEAVASALYGSNWNQQIDDLADSFFTNYDLGSAVGAAADFNRTSVSAAASSINVDKGLGSGSTAAGVSMMKASDSPAGATLPLEATGVNFLKFSVSNSGSSAAMLSSLTVKRSGPGSASDFEAVYLYKGMERITTGRTINSSSNEAAFSGLNLSIPAGGSVSMWIAADIAAGAGVGDVNALSVSSAMVGSNAVSGAPIMGSSFNIAGADVGDISIEESGTISNVKAGGMGQKVAQFRVEAGSEEDVDLHSVSLTFDGDSRSNISNLVLKQGGLTLASTSSISDKDLAVFALSNPMYMEKGSQRTFEVYADVAAGSRAADMISFYLDENSDLRAVGRTYGHGLMVTNDFLAGDQDTEVEAGKLTTTFNGPASKDVAVNGKDVELYNFTMAAQSNLEVRQLVFVVDIGGFGSDVEDAISDLKVVDTASGAIVAGPQDGNGFYCDGSAATTEEDFCFNETWNLASGTARTFRVTADIEGVDGDTISVTLGDGGLFPNANKVRNLDNSTYLTSSDMVPSTQLGGNSHSVNDSMLDVDNASTPVAQTYIKGASNVALGGWTFTAGDAGSIKVNTVSIDCYWDGTGDCDEVVQTAKLMNGATQLGSTESPDSSDMITFDNLNLTINAGQTLTLVVYGTISNSASSDYLELTFDDVDATDADGADVPENDMSGTGPTMDIASEGDMLVTLATSTDTDPGLVIGGSQNAVLAKYKLTAIDEELKMTKARFQVDDETVVSSLSLYDGSTLIGGPSSVNGSGVVSFSNLNLVVPKDGNKTFTVKGSINMIAASVGVDPVPMADATVTFLDEEYEFRGTSAGSSTVLTEEDGDNVFDDLLANEKLVVKSKPSVQLVGSSTTLVEGSQTVLKFTVTADPAGDIAIGGFDVDVTESLDGMTACVGGSSSVKSSATNDYVAGTCEAFGAGLNQVISIVFTNEEEIGAGESRTYEVRFSVTGADGETLTTFLEESGFIWSDKSESTHDTSSLYTGSDDWFTDGEYVKVLPTDSNSMDN